ncbi:MAG: putative bifunctional diguanylate cyclase/phosphodiesterase [Acidiferrobacterales bacterium]
MTRYHKHITKENSGLHSGRFIHTLDKQLEIRPSDIKLIQRHARPLEKIVISFIPVLEKHLKQSPDISASLERQCIDANALAVEFSGYMNDALKPQENKNYSRWATSIASLFKAVAIETPALLGIYSLFLQFTQQNIYQDKYILATEKLGLFSALTKILFRDMGIQLFQEWQHRDKKSTLAHDKIVHTLENIPHLLWSVDPVNKKIIFRSPHPENCYSIVTHSPIPYFDKISEHDKKLLLQAWDKCLLGQATEVECEVSDGGIYKKWFRHIFTPHIDIHGKVARIDGVSEDITTKRNTLAELQSLATKDVLTGLSNRTLFSDQLTQAIKQAKKSRTNKVAVILVDIDRFKEINNTLGHQAGDALLTTTAQRLSALKNGAFLARLGGDEFALFMIGADIEEKSRQLISKIETCFSHPFNYNDNELYLNASIGISIFPEHGDSVESLLRCADVAMYSSKRYEGVYRFYSAEDDPYSHLKLQLANELHEAISRQQLQLHYQPKINMATGRIEGVEALIRWLHPTKGIVFPEQFLPIAESAGYMNTITDWVITEAVQQTAIWYQSGYNLRVAVNLSGRVFQDPRLAHRIENKLSDINLPAQYFEIEVTENELMNDIEDASKTLRALSELGISIAIDDFGTGYSSLSYLKKLPLNTLKIDKSFVMDMTNDESDAVIVRSIIDLAHNLGRRVVAEGIEDKETWELLSMLGCDGAQGYFISHPLPVSEFNQWISIAPWNLDEQKIDS